MSAAKVARHSVSSLGRFPLRSAAVMFATMIGVGSLTFVVSVGQAAETKLTATVRQLFGASSIVVTAGGGFFMGGPRGPAARLTVDDVQAVVAEVPGVLAWDAMEVLPETPVRRGDRNTSVRLLGLSDRLEEVWNRSASRGRSLEAPDIASAARVALLGETVVAQLFHQEDPVGQEVLLGGGSFTVVGVLEEFGTDIHGMDRDNEIVVPYTTAMRRVMNVDTLRGAKLVFSQEADLEALAEQAARVLRERHGLALGRPDDFNLVTSVAVRKMLGRVERILFFYLPLVTGAALLGATAVSASVMLQSVKSRVGEIGLRRALGATTEDIRLQFLVETAATTLAGGAFGILLGALAAHLATARLGMRVFPSPGGVVLGLALSVLTGLFAGVVPARRAALLHPVDALR